MVEALSPLQTAAERTKINHKFCFYIRFSKKLYFNYLLGDRDRVCDRGSCSACSSPGAKKNYSLSLLKLKYQICCLTYQMARGDFGLADGWPGWLDWMAGTPRAGFGRRMAPGLRCVGSMGVLAMG